MVWRKNPHHDSYRDPQGGFTRENPAGGVRTPKSPKGGLKNHKVPKGGAWKRLIINMKELDKNMYFGAKPGVMDLAKSFRNSMTYYESLLWEKLNGKKICGVRFRRQHPINFFIADFYSHEVRLVVEVDGEIHTGKIDYDDGRSAEMEKFGIKVIRFTNFEIENNIVEVIYRIETIVNERLKNPQW
jgi:very-short-patch-repair endonuclease